MAGDITKGSSGSSDISPNGVLFTIDAITCKNALNSSLISYLVSDVLIKIK